MNYGQPGFGFHARPPKKGLSTAAIIFIVLGCTFGGCLGVCGVVGVIGSRQQASSSGAASTSQTPTPTAETVTYTKVSAGTLIDDYEGNEVRGDNAWKGHAVEVTGVVRSIDKGPMGGLYVSLVDGGKRMSFHSVDVNLKADQTARAAALNKGDTATFRGRVLGYTLGSVSIRDAEMD